MNLSRLWLPAVAFALGSGAASANDQLIKLSKDPNQWVMPAGDYANTRYSTLDQINKDNVKNLRPVWTFSTGVLRGHEGGPLVIGDVMYLSTPFPNNVFALDLNNNGRILWKYEPKQDPTVIPVMCCDTVNRGVAYGDGKIFLHQADTTSWRSMPRPATSSGASRTGIRKRAKPEPVPRWSSKTRCSSASAAASSASRPDDGVQHQGRVKRMAGLFGGPRRPDPVRRQHHRAWQACWQEFIIEDMAGRSVENRVSYE